MSVQGAPLAADIGAHFCDDGRVLRMLWLLLSSAWIVFWRRRRRGPLRPTWKFYFEVLITTMRRDSDAREDWPVTRVRKHLQRLRGPREALRKIYRHPVQVGDRSGVWMRADKSRPPETWTEGDVLLYFHGGSYLYGSVENTHADIMARLALATGMPILGVDYRLAPENPYPAALDDALASYEWLLAQGVPARRVVLAGDSSGGNLAIAMLLLLRDRMREAEAAEQSGSGATSGVAELPRAAVLISPWVDLLCRRPSMERNAAYDFGTRSMLLAQAEHFAGSLSPGDPRISVIDADLGGLPPLLVQVGGAELLEDECREFAERARAAGVQVQLDVLVDMPHAGQLFAAYAPEGARAITRAATFLTAGP